MTNGNETSCKLRSSNKMIFHHPTRRSRLVDSLKNSFNTLLIAISSAGQPRQFAVGQLIRRSLKMVSKQRCNDNVADPSTKISSTPLRGARDPRDCIRQRWSVRQGRGGEEKEAISLDTVAISLTPLDNWARRTNRGEDWLDRSRWKGFLFQMFDIILIGGVSFVETTYGCSFSKDSWNFEVEKWGNSIVVWIINQVPL